MTRMPANFPLQAHNIFFSAEDLGQSLLELAGEPGKWTLDATTREEKQVAAMENYHQLCFQLIRAARNIHFRPVGFSTISEQINSIYETVKLLGKSNDALSQAGYGKDLLKAARIGSAAADRASNFDGRDTRFTFLDVHPPAGAKAIPLLVFDSYEKQGYIDLTTCGEPYCRQSLPGTEIRQHLYRLPNEFWLMHLIDPDLPSHLAGHLLCDALAVLHFSIYGIPVPDDLAHFVENRPVDCDTEFKLVDVAAKSGAKSQFTVPPKNAPAWIDTSEGQHLLTWADENLSKKRRKLLGVVAESHPGSVKLSAIKVECGWNSRSNSAFRDCLSRTNNLLLEVGYFIDTKAENVFLTQLPDARNIAEET